MTHILFYALTGIWLWDPVTSSAERLCISSQTEVEVLEGWLGVKKGNEENGKDRLTFSRQYRDCRELG